MADVAQLLQGLHPMREPPPPSPVAPFLLMLGLGVALAIVAFLVWRLSRRRHIGLRHAAERALAASRTLPPPERVAAQALMLRRLVRARTGDTAVRAQGDGWLATLDDMFATRFFSEGAGRAYAEALYRRDGAGQTVAQVETLDRSLADLLARMSPSSSRIEA